MPKTTTTDVMCSQVSTPRMASRRRGCSALSALSALLLGIVLGLLTRPASVYEGFYDPLFSGLLSGIAYLDEIEAL
jgi:hypothetical protein